MITQSIPHKLNITLNQFFVVFITLLIFAIPAVPIGGLDVDLPQFLLWALFAIYFFYTDLFTRVPKKFFLLPLGVLLYMVAIPFGHSGHVVEVAEKSINPQYFQLFHSLITNFYTPNAFKAYLLLVHMLEFSFIFIIFFRMGASGEDHNKSIVVCFFIALAYETIICLAQHFLLGALRTPGTIGNAQIIGVFCIPIYIYKLDFKWKYLDFIFYIPLLILSDTRSSFAVFILLILLNAFKPRLLFWVAIGTILANYVFAVVLAGNEETKTLVLGAATVIFKNSSTLTIRYLMWGSSFTEILRMSPWVGTFGRLPQFPDNIIWFFLIPFGYVGLLAYLTFFYYILRLKNKKATLLIFAFFFQGFTFHGAMVPPVSYLWWAMLGLAVGEEFKIRDACKYYLSAKNL